MNPILLDFPDSFQTRRLLVRAPKAGDGIAVCDAIRTSLPDLKPWMPFAREEQKKTKSKSTSGVRRLISFCAKT